MNTLLWPFWAVLWTILVLWSYWAFHPYYALALGQWPNGGMALTLLALSGGAWYLLRGPVRELRGWMVYAWVLLLIGVVFTAYAFSQQLFPSGVGGPLFRFLGNSVMLHAAFLIMILWPFALGDWLLRSLRAAYAESTFRVLALALGISVTGLLLFLAAAFGLLKIWVLWPVVAMVLIWRRHRVLEVLHDLFLKPIALKGEPGWGLAAILMSCAAMAVALVGMVKAFPMGFDGAALYMNTAHLIAGSGTLPRPGQGFNWELFMSQGEILFGRISASIILSHGSMVLVMMVLYRLGRLFLSRAGAWLAVSLMFLNPAFSFHAMLDEKVDLGFLFIILSALLLVLGRQRGDTAASADRAMTVALFGRRMDAECLVWALAGWLSGYAFGIKYTGLLAMAGLASLMAYRKGGAVASAGMLLVTTGILFLAGVHRFAYLDLEGTPAWVLALIGLLPGLALMGYAARKQPAGLGWMVGRLGIFGLMALLQFLPWMVKHVSEHGSWSIAHMVQGKPRTIHWNTADFMARQRAGAAQPQQLVLQAIRALGVELRPEQQAQVATVISRYRFGSAVPMEERRKQIMGAREEVIRDILDDGQRAIVESRLAQKESGSRSGDGEALETTYHMLVQNLGRRGVELSSEQGLVLLGILEEAFLDGRLRPGDREAVMAIREEVFRRVLNEEQQERVAGVRADTPQAGVGRQRFRTSELTGVQREEVKRYIGYEPGFPLYLSVPYDVTMNTRIPFSRYLDISFLFLLLLPFLLASGRIRNFVTVSFTSLVIWTISVYSLYSDGKNPPDPREMARVLAEQQGGTSGWLASMIGEGFESIQYAFVSLGRLMHEGYVWLSSFSIAWSFLASLLAYLALVVLAKRRFRSWPVPIREVICFIGGFALLWLLLGNAIVWYGFPFLALLFPLIAWVYEQPGSRIAAMPSRFANGWWRGGVWASLVLGASLFFVSGIQPAERAAMLYNGPFLRHAAQPQTMKETYGQFLPYMAETIAALNTDPKARIYRVGTYFNFHIERNDRRVFEDNQLGFYGETVSALGKKEDFVQLLKENGFRYVLYDLNTTVIDKTPEKSLSRKANDFFLTLANSAHVRPLYTDNFVYDPAVPYTQIGKIRVPGKPGIGGENTMAGTFILFELL